MVARFKTGTSIYGALAYNESKVEQGGASFVGAIYTTAKADEQSLKEKTDSLHKLADRNTRTKRNSVHIALSFAKDDKLDPEQLRAIAKDYLKGIGFDKQPAYIYRHSDTDNDHIHIVTTNITREGKRINDKFIGVKKSEPTRKQIEIDYNLVKAEEQGQKKTKAERVAAVGEPEGKEKAELKAYARNTVRAALSAYKPASIGELNAVLRERELKVREVKGVTQEGKEYRGHSVVRIDSFTGEETSAAIKSSQLFDKGWGGKLDQTFAKNATSAKKNVKGVREKVKQAFSDKKASAGEIRKQLSEAGIRVIDHRNEAGRRYGLHYVDEGSGNIYKASSVGRQFGANRWNEVEATNTLSSKEYQSLMTDAKSYLENKKQEAGYQSIAVKELNTRSIAEAMEAKGHDKKLIQPYLKEYVETVKETYDKTLGWDQRKAKDYYWGTAGIRPEYRQSVIDSLGLEQKGEKVHLRGNEEISTPAGEQAVRKSKEVKLPVGTLSPVEKRMILGVGRYRGIGGIPRNVNLDTVDWKYWESKFKPKVAKQLGEQLHNNYVKSEIKAAQENKQDKEPHMLVRLAGKGILIEPKADGYYAHVLGHDDKKLRVPEEVAVQLFDANYQVGHYEQTKKGVEETIGQEDSKNLRQEKPKVMQSESKKDPKRTRYGDMEFALRMWTRRTGASVARSGRYEVMNVQDEDENISWEERKMNRQLKF